MVTVKSELQRLFPKGTRPTKKPASRYPWIESPYLPADVFAAAAHLLHASGAYQYIVAPFAVGAHGDHRYAYSPPTFAPDQSELDEWMRIGRDWSLNPKCRVEVQKIWRQLYLHKDQVLVVSPGHGAQPPAWWKPCHALLVIADEASGDFGYDPVTSAAALSGPGKWANRIATLTLFSATDRWILRSKTAPNDPRHLGRHVTLDSLCSDAVERHVARVLPKGRTTEIGCTLRTFSHNLTLLPPHGQLNAYWHQQMTPSTTSDPDVLNVLLIPFPYVIAPNAFRGGKSTIVDPDRPWGRFQIDQRWLRPDGATAAGPDWSTPESIAQFVEFVDELIRKAESTDPVHGIALPELALDWDTYDALVRHLRTNRPNVEFVVAGVSRDCNGHAGNLVTTTMLHELPGGVRVAETHSRGKHHRWQVAETQVHAYGIDGQLDETTTWWEHLPVGGRALQINVLREGSTFTAVICEDLARVEPGLSLLRSLGPNLVFALLMDGPQISPRWPSIYATALADDPGSSVLSMTCAGMVRRSNDTRMQDALKRRAAGSTDDLPTLKQIVALWKNLPGPHSSNPPLDYAQLELAAGDHAILLRLVGTAAHETTMDGRANSDSRAWYLRGYAGIAIDPAKLDSAGWRWISGP